MGTGQETEQVGAPEWKYFQYDFQDWTNNEQNGKAYNAISTYVVVKSNSPIEKATVQD